MSVLRRDVDPQVLRELIALHAGVLLRMPVVALLVWAAVAAQNVGTVPGAALLGWGALIVGVESLRAAYSWRLRTARTQGDPARAHLELVWLAGLSGLSMGVSGALFFPSMPAESRVMLSAIYFAMTAGGVAVAASSQTILAAYSLTMMVPAALAWGWVVPSQGVAIVGLSLLYCVFLIAVAGDGERLLARSIRIRQERDRVVADLQRRNEDVQAAMAAAETAAQARSRVLAAASHDLRQPLHALSICSAILNAGPDEAALKEVSRNIDQLVRSLGNLLNGLLDLSRLSSGHFVPERKAFALERIVGDVCDEMAGAAQAKGLALVRRIGSARVESDPTALGRVLRNLVDNAIKYTDRGTITVSVEVREGRARMSVDDTGRGIPAAEQARIFEEFYQLDNAARDRSKGVGLGLAIVQRLVELLDATIEVRSEPGRGACFTVSMPALAAPDPAPDPAPDAGPGAARAPRFAGQRVWVVDDEPDIQRSMRTLLEVWGLQARAFGSGAELEAALDDDGAPALLIADLRLGGDEHGAALARRLRARHPELQVLIMTGETSSVALRDANRDRLPLLHKPVVPETLSDALAAALSPRRDPAPLHTPR